MKQTASLVSILLLTSCSSASERDAKAAIESTLNDPMSVQYRKVETFSNDVVCGEYNAKNKLGGYVGFKPFVFRHGGLIEHDVTANSMHLCDNKPGTSEIRVVVIPYVPVQFASASEKTSDLLIWLYIANGHESLSAMEVYLIRQETAGTFSKLTNADYDDVTKRQELEKTLPTHLNKVLGRTEETGVQYFMSLKSSLEPNNLQRQE